MTDCEELRPKAAGIASLDESDPERQAYLAHARTCEGCMQALREGEKLMAALGRATLPAPSAQALLRASAPVLRELRPPSSWGLRAGSALAAAAVPILFARHHDWEGWAAALVVLAAATALGATAGLWKAGAWVGLAASAGFALAAGGVPGFPRAGAGFSPGIGLDCFGLEILGGAIAALLALRAVAGHSLAAAAAAGALAAQAALHISCLAHGQAPHLWLFHVGGVAAAAALGWVLQQRVYPSSARS
ncbi:MAG TPA: hypothetical protein VFP52_02110 [Myxococcales bacterium]|nr:hypothetical protein [Myxococcales bacterium]